MMGYVFFQTNLLPLNWQNKIIIIIIIIYLFLYHFKPLTEIKYQKVSLY